MALGSTSHAIGTAKAIEIGEVEGIISGLAICVNGILTVLLLPLFFQPLLACFDAKTTILCYNNQNVLA